MKHIMIAGVAALLLVVQAGAEEAQPLKTQKDRISYVIGVDQIRNFKRQGIDADLELVIRGMRDAASGGRLLIGEAESQKILADYSVELKAKQAQLKKDLAEKNKKAGAAFLAENKKQEGVVTTASGLQYKVLKAGTGKSPADDDAVTVKYRGTLIDGSEFSSSELLGYPITFYVKDSVIAGWAEALKLMSAGARWQVFVPPQLAYAEKGAGRDIGPNATLIYDIELIAVDPQTTTPDKKKGTSK
jgi:FKBP-type peptidyl-prolyl cis-trans isomerase FklB